MDLLKIIIIPIFFIINNITSQVIVNNINLNDNVNEFEVWVIKKRFSSKESMFVNSCVEVFDSLSFHKA